MIVRFLNALIWVAEVPVRALIILRRLAKWRKRSGHYLVELGERHASNQSNWAIPPNVYQTTKSRLIDHEHYEEINRFRDMNPELSFFVFDEKETDAYMTQHWGSHPIHDVYKRALFGQIKADIFRLCILWDKGGYYFDINKAAFTNLRSLHSSTSEALLTFDRDDCVIFPDVNIASQLEFPHKLFAQWGFAFSPRHKILEMAIDRIVELSPFFSGRALENGRDAIWAFSAPGMLTDVIRKYLGEFGFGNVVIAGRYFHETSFARVRGSQRSPVAPVHYTSARNTPILRGVFEGLPESAGRESAR